MLREIIHRKRTVGGPPFPVLFTGPLGCGKTFVLRKAMDTYNRYNDSKPYNAFVICASTFKAAVAVGGTTVHSVFKHSRKSKKADLTDSELNAFRVAFRKVKCAIIDKVRLLSSDN